MFPTLVVSKQRRIAILAALYCGTFLSSLDLTVVGTAMPSIASELGGLSLYGWVFSAYLLTATVTVPMYGRLADLWGRKQTYLLGMTLFLVGSLACGAARSMPALVAARAVQGLGAGALVPLNLIVVGDLYVVQERAKMISLFSVVWGVSSMLGPTVGGALVALGWPWIFFVNLPVGLLAMVVLSAALPTVTRDRRASLDVLGAFLVTLGTVSLLGALTALEKGQRAFAFAGFVVAFASVFGLVRTEQRAEEPILPPVLFRDPALVVAAIVSTLLGSVLFTVMAYVPLFLRAVGGYSIVAAGAGLVPMTVAWTAGSFSGGTLFARFGFRGPLRIACIVVATSGYGFLLAALLDAPLLAVASTGIMGGGMGVGVTAINLVAQERAPLRMRGAATALQQFARTMGGTLLVSLLGLLMVSLLSQRLAQIPGAPSASVLVDPERTRHLDPAVIAAARDALRGALSWVFGAVAVAGTLSFFASARMPLVAMPARETAESTAVETPE